MRLIEGPREPGIILALPAAMIRVGIVGAGVVTSGSHLPVLVNMPDVSVSWVCDRSLPTAAAVARSYGIAGAYGEIRRCPDVDVVLVATPVGSRNAVVPEVLERGWHALCEKPFALTLADHRAYMAAARAKGLQIAVAQVRRYAKPTASAQALLARRVFGTPVRVVAAEGFQMRGTGRDTGWHMNDRGAGGVLGEFGSHLIDQMLYMLGATSAARVSVRRCGERVHRDLELAASLVADVTVPDGSTIACAVDVSLIDDLCNGVFIAFRDVTLRVGLGFEDTLSLVSNDGDTLAEIGMPAGVDSPVQGFYREWRDFLRQCRDGAPSPIDAGSVEATTAVIDGGRTAARETPAAERAS